jgi:hypothetical protein
MEASLLGRAVALSLVVVVIGEVFEQTNPF